MIVGLDIGRSSVKLFDGINVLNFPSIVGEWRDRNLKSSFSKNDLEVEFQGEQYFVGALAENESEFSRSMMTDNKCHDDTLILALTALHQANISACRVVTGLPIKSHDAVNKARLKSLLQGRHEIAVNGECKDIIIKSVDVAAEGGAAFWSDPRPGKVRLIDGGSKTINFVTMKDKKYVDRDSGTLDFGFETNKSVNDKQLIARIAGELGKKWSSNDTILTSGGKADVLADHLQVYFSNVSPIRDALYANAIGYHNIGGIIHV
ncbi:ParM/StbA family protein [Bacillaceae bacterium IKA-2]|nr:ParM/StbA family protein [Bacillaceae bacterium IKA-2]